MRDALLGNAPNDVDFATDAKPDTVISLATEYGMDVNLIGVVFGVTMAIVDGRTFSITSFRRDIENDGLHPVVEFSDSIEEDARRRDFTINALYADTTGLVIDPLNSIDDLWCRKVRFIGDPEQRIREDYIRMLRFFRIFATIGDSENGLDSAAIEAISKLSHTIGLTSRHRVGKEMVRLLQSEKPSTCLKAMQKTGLLEEILPGAEIRLVEDLERAENRNGVRPDGIRRLALIGGENAAFRLALTNQEASRLERLSMGMSGSGSIFSIGHQYGGNEAVNIALLTSVVNGTVPERGFKRKAEYAAKATFPIRATDLMPELAGSSLGEKLAELRQIWYDSECRMDRATLLEYAR